MKWHIIRQKDAMQCGVACCDGGCAYHRYRNMFEGCHFDLCSPYKDVEQLKKAY